MRATLWEADWVFGSRAKSPFGTLLFVAGNYQLLVFLLNNVEVGARVSKADKSAFSDAEMKTIMNADVKAPWLLAPSTDPTTLQWTRADKATVLYDRDRKMLIFTSPQMAAAIHAKPATSTPPPAAPRTPPPPVIPAQPVTSP